MIQGCWRPAQPPADDFAALLAQEVMRVTEGGYGYLDPPYPQGVHPADIAMAL